MDNNKVFDPMVWASQNNANNISNEHTDKVSPVTNQIAPNPDDELAKAQATADELLRMGANIAESYDEYLHLGMALSNGLGEQGHDIYHQLCAQSSKYREGDCEKKWQECLHKNDGRITIASFYKMAQDAGVDLTAIARQFPSKPQLPHGYEEKRNQQGAEDNNREQHSNYQSQTNKSNRSGAPTPIAADSVEETEVLRFSFSQTFSPKIDIGTLPVTIQRCMEGKETAEEQDKTLLATLDLLAIAQPNVYGIYGGKRVYTPFYLFILGLAGISQKGAVDDLKHLLMPIEHALLSQYYAQLADYKEQHAEWEAKKSQRGKGTESAGPEPEEPQYRSLFVSADSSAAAFKQDLCNYGGRGMVFSTEADTLTQALSQEWGQFTDILRMAFHHETITSTRTKDKQHIVIDEPQLGMMVTCTPKQITYLLSPKQNENGSSSRDLFYCAKENLEWRDPFQCKEPVADRYNEIGQSIKQMYDQLVGRKSSRIQILLTEEQQQAFNKHFKPLLPEQVGLYGLDFAAFIVRIALVAFRMMMVLTTLRNFEQGHLTDPQQQAFICTDDDYQTAMTIIDCLVAHTAYVYTTLLKPTDEQQQTIQPLKAREQQFLIALPNEFTTKQSEETAQALGIPIKTAQRYIGSFISRYQLVERTGQGHYSKIKR